MYDSRQQEYSEKFRAAYGELFFSFAMEESGNECSNGKCKGVCADYVKRYDVENYSCGKSCEQPDELPAFESYPYDEYYHYVGGDAADSD